MNALMKKLKALGLESYRAYAATLFLMDYVPGWTDELLPAVVAGAQQWKEEDVIPLIDRLLEC